jgi:hypothetical protein
MSAPVLSTRKLPVPYVFFASPGEKQTCPTVVACWSPRQPAIGTSAPIGPFARVTPNRPAPHESQMRGSMARGTSNSCSSSSSQSSVRRFISCVRLGVGDVGDVEAAVAAAGQVPDDPAVDRAEDGLAGERRGTHARDVREKPLQLR